MASPPPLNHSRSEAPEPQAYARAIAAYAQRTKHASLFPGQNYKALADFLSRPYATRPKNFTTKIHDDSAFVTVHEYDPNGLVTTSRYGPHEDDLTKLASHPKPPGHAQLIFMRGFLSPEWLNNIGTHFRIDPAFFRRHLDFIEVRDHFDLPTLPSASSHILTLPLTTIGVRTPRLATTESLGRSRRETTRMTVATQLRDLERNIATGQTIVRNVSLHDESHFTIEQDVSVFVKPKGDSWFAVVWSDCGKGFSRTTLSSWIGTHDSISIMPIYQHKHKVALGNDELTANPEPGSGTAPRNKVSSHLNTDFSDDSFQSASLLPYANGQSLDAATIPKDVFYALSEVFTFIAFSSTQQLNLIANMLVKERSKAILNKDLSQMDSSIAALEHLQASLEVHTTKISAILTALKSHSSAGRSWAVSEPLTRESAIADAAATVLISDYEFLLGRAKQLAEQCATQSTLLMNRATLDIAQRGILQSERVRLLTLLAFLFVPLGITTSFFGMNFFELQDSEGPKLSIWVWFSISLPVFLISCVICFLESVKKWQRWFVLRWC